MATAQISAPGCVFAGGNLIKFLSFLLALFLTPLFGVMADVACPSGYTQVIEDVVYTSYGDSCPNGDTKLGGEYGEDSILSCIGAQSSTVPICTYFAESCQPGMSFDGLSHQSCPSGSYCDGTGTATPGVAGCTQTCPLNSNSRSGATSVTDCTCNDGYYMNNGVCETCPAGYACSGGEMTQCENGTYSVAGQSICTSCPPVKNVHGAGVAVVESVNAAESIDACEAVYMFMSQYIVQLVQQYEELPPDWDSSEYNPDSDANKRGFINVYCKYDAKSQDYVADCNSHVWSCEGGYYADDSGQEGAYPPSYTSNTLDDIIKNSCRPVGENYWSPSYSTYISGPDDNVTFDEVMTTIYDKYPCPENSSTRGDTTATYCTCNDGYTVTGTIGGSIQTTTNACIKFMCEDGYYQNGNTCEICPVGSYCANNTKTACDTGYTTDNTGATSESQCYTTCTKQCTPQTCPENATCTHGTTTTTGKEYVGTACDGEQTACEIVITCNSGYSLTDGECVSDDFDAEFTITTTNIPANESFWFYLSAAGTYKVNWGDGNIEKIEKTNTTNEQISHIYATSGTYEIKLAGDAIRYNSDSYNNVAAIRFSYDDTDVIGNPYLKTISGSLGKIFPTLSSSTNGKLQPSFRRLFTNCENLTGAIPAELFTGVYGTPLGRMFMAAFMNTKITEQLPSDLFSGMDGQISENLFRETFSGCTELTGTIPADLFGNLSGDLQARTFYHTFYGCEKLTGYVPKTLFAKFSRSNESNQMTDVFYNTGLATYCPANEYVYDTGFNDLFSSRVACTPCPSTHPNSVAGSTSESQCYVTCTKQCTQQTCPENSVNCTHGNEISSGHQYYGSNCDATEIVCDIDFSCSVGYDKLSFADTLVRNMDTIYDSAEYDNYCQLNNTGNSCDTLPTGQYMWYFDTSNGSPIYSVQIQTTCTDDMGNDADPQSRINYNADFDIQRSGANCWERVLYLNDSPVSSSWIYNQTYDSAEDCAAYCGFSKPMSVGYALAVATNANLCAPHEYTVTYDCNGGTGNATDTATYKTTFTPRTDVCERSGYKFLGWTLNGENTSNSFVWNTTNDQTLIATWQQLSATCTAGEYLPANTTVCAPCKENNYCPGGTYNTSDKDVGINPCPSYSTSPSGATYCTCDNDFSIDGTAKGSKQTTTDACKLIPEFTITTTNMSSKTFPIYMTAGGVFYIDCGKDGTPLNATSINGSVGTIITNVRNDGLSNKYGCTYTSSGKHSISLAGQATEYSTYFTPSSQDENDYYAPAYYMPAIRFAKTSSENYIYNIEGSLGHIFGTLQNGTQPSFAMVFTLQNKFVGPIPEDLFDGIYGAPIIGMFAQAFYNCSKLSGSIPPNLFKNIKGPATQDLFSGLFYFCTNLSGAIPENLFQGITGSADHMFFHTFSSCTKLTSIPENLFKNLSGSATEMFSSTFDTCTSITSIPKNLFASITGNAPGLFRGVFYECTSLTNIPQDLFSGVSGGAENMFRAAFVNCTSLNSIPENLFANITDITNCMFCNTFKGCSELQKIPDNLFGNIKGKPTEDIFDGTFLNCTNLSGNVPVDLFRNLDSTGYKAGPMSDIFNNTSLNTQCPANMYQYKTGFEVDWSGKVACTLCPNKGISLTGSTDITQCYIDIPCGKYTNMTTSCYYSTDTSDYTNCAECSIDTSCPYNQELVNGKCAPCNRDNALDYHTTGNCMVSECEQGFYPYMQQCMPEKIECDAPKANVAYKYWDVANRAYGPCIITECIDDKYHIEANACVPNTQSCDVEHGIGEQEWDFEQNKWGACVAVQCDSGYTTDQSLTNDTLNGQCGRCSNMYVDDEMAVSTYISECEIASCMYQGEKYILENNECLLICDERSDETGSRYWNGNKCVHECAEGYSIWE